MNTNSITATTDAVFTTTPVSDAPIWATERGLSIGQVDAAIECAWRTPALAGFYDVIMHGDYRVVLEKRGEGWKEWSPADLARVLSSLPCYKGQAIRLVSCWTGTLSDGFAQALADELGVPVMAPTERVGANEDFTALRIINGGIWRFFLPADF